MDRPNAADEIRVLPGNYAIRHRPELYLGPLEAPDLAARLVLQGLCHALDELAVGACSHVDIRLGDDGRVAITYDAGLPLDPKPGHGDAPAAHVFLTELHACRDDRARAAVGERACGIGLPVLNALSETLDVTTRDGARRCTLRYERGLLVVPWVLEVDDAAPMTRIDLRLDGGPLRGNTGLSVGALRAAVVGVTDEIPCLAGEIAIRDASARGDPTPHG